MEYADFSVDARLHINLAGCCDEPLHAMALPSDSLADPTNPTNSETHPGKIQWSLTAVNEWHNRKWSRAAPPGQNSLIPLNAFAMPLASAHDQAFGRECLPGSVAMQRASAP